MRDLTECDQKWHEREGACYMCCTDCDYDTHQCKYCGTHIMHNGMTGDGVSHGPCPEYIRDNSEEQ